MRGDETSDDFAGISEVFEEVLGEYKKRNIEYKYFCCIFATAPFVTAERLIEGFNLLINGGYNSVFPVVKYSYPIQRALQIENNKIGMIWPENYSKRSQDLLESYHDSGQFYWLNIDAFLKEKRMFMDNSGAIIIPESEVQDIDTEEDWKIAEMKYKIINDIY
jgi:N-acylneuraminate cytidylyltransferase